MTFLHPGRYALGVVAAVAILTACGGSQSSNGAALPQSASSPVAPAAGSIQDIYSFLGSPDGQEPRTGVVALTKRQCGAPCDHVGLIGTTTLGGDANSDGTVYGLTPGKKGAWKESVLYAFKGTSSADGSEPSGLALGDSTSGAIRQALNAYMTIPTSSGGTTNNGALVVLVPTGSGPWKESFIYSFGGTPDGATPFGNPLVDKKGNVYGTTYAGGATGAGAVYRMQPPPKGSGYTESILYSFQGGSDGDGPRAGLVVDKKGGLYGTTAQGGTTGSGTVFKLTPAGNSYKESVLYSFQGMPDGSGPLAGVCGDVPQGDGNYGDLYGTTEKGGTQNLGTVYKLTANGNTYKESVLWSFGSVQGDGAYPFGGVLVDKQGVIYGTTLEGGSGGSSGPGTFFTLTPSGSTYKETVSVFTGADGEYPYAGPSVDSKGNLYLTTEAGGAKGKGTVNREGSSPSVSECF